jgi:hypothetical protein
VNELFGSRALAPSKAFKKEAIAAYRTPDGKCSDIFDVDDDETQLLLDDCHPQLLRPQDSPCKGSGCTRRGRSCCHICQAAFCLPFGH